MNILHSLQKLKMLKRLFVSAIVFCLMVVFCQVKTYPHISLKGLFNVLKIDDIGFGHALLHSKWIENMYQYGPGKPHKQMETGEGQTWSAQKKNDAIANLVRTLWFRKDENHALEPTQEPSEAFKHLDVNKFGLLINLTYKLVLLEAVRQERRKACTCEYTQVQKEIKKFKLNKLFGKLNEIRKKLEKKLFQEQNKELQQKDGLSAFEESKRLFELEKIRVSQATQEIIKKYRELTKNIEKKEISKLNAFRKKEIAQAQESSRVDCLHQGMILALVGYIKILVKEAGVYDYDGQIIGLEKSVQKRKELSKRLDELEKPQVNLGEISKIIKGLETDEQGLSQELQELSFLVKYIRPALDACRQGRYAPRTVEGVLWAFFFHKIDKLSSLQEKVDAIKSCLGNISPEFKNQDLEEGDLGECYAPEKFAEYEQEIKKIDVDKQIEKIKQKYDLGLHYFISLAVGAKFPPVIGMGSFGYEYEEGKLSGKTPNCHETATLDALSVLWYNRETKKIDDSLIKDGLGFKKLREALKYLYLADSKRIKVEEYTCRYKGRKFTSIEKLKKLGKITEKEIKDLDISQVPVSYINRSEIKQEFTNIVSGLLDEGVIYCSKISELKEQKNIFELDSDVRNVLKIFNYFYGTSAQNFEELGDKEKGISTDFRSVTFEKANDKNAPNDITICVQDKDSHMYFDMVVEVGGGHTELSVPGRKKTSLKILKEGFVKAFLERARDQRCSTIFTLLTSYQLLEDKDLDLNLSLSMLQLVYYSLPMENVVIKNVIIKDLLKKHLKHYDVCREMIRNLIENFPIDDAYLGAELVKIILDSGFCSKEPYFYELVKSIVTNPRFYIMRLMGNREVSVEKILRLAIEKKQRNIALLIAGHEKFNPAGWPAAQILSIALKQGYQVVAAKIAANPRFSAWGLALEDALQEGWQDVANEIIAHERFSAHYASKALALAIRKKYKDIALAIVFHKTFNGSDIGDALEWALKRDYKEIAAVITKASQFSLGYSWEYKSVDLLVLALRKKHEQVALDIVNLLQFDASKYGMDKALLLALQQEYIEVAFAIINNVKFQVNLGINTRDIFKAALEALVKNKEGKYRDLILTIIGKPGFNASSWEMIKILEQALKQRELDIALAIVKHETFRARGLGMGDVFKIALGHKEYYEIALIIATNKFFDASIYGIRDALKAALENDYKEIVFAIVKNEKFDAGNYGIVDALILALEKSEEYKDIANIIVNHEKFNGDGYSIGKALSLALKNKYQNIAAKIIGAAKFKCWERALEFSLEQQWKTVAWEIFEHPQFAMKSKNLGKVLVITLGNEEYADMAQKIIENPEFKDWSGALSFAMSTLRQAPLAGVGTRQDIRDKGVALELLSHPACDLSDGVGYTLKDTVEKGLKDLAFKILAHPTLNSETKMGGALKEAMEKEHDDIITKIIEHKAFDPSSDSMGYILAMGLKDQRYSTVAEKILHDPCFNRLAEALNFAAGKGWKGVVSELVKYENFDFSPENSTSDLTFALSSIIKQGWRAIALDLINHTRFNANAEYMYSAIEEALKAGFKDIALAIIEHPIFDVNKFEHILYFIGKVAQEKKEYAQDVEEVIEILKQKKEKSKK